jgi:glutamate racemase
VAAGARVALVDSGLGVLPAAAELRRRRPDLDLVLAMDPDHMPWGHRTPEEVAELALAAARAAAGCRPGVLILACNTGSVHALARIRAELEPSIPVVGTVPAIKPAAASGGAIAVWATPATTGSRYQQELIRRFADGVEVAEVASPGLASAVEAGDQGAIERAVAEAAARTPPGVRALVLGCTQYALVAEEIRRALPSVDLFDSAAAVAAQALRRLASGAAETGTGSLTVLLSGRRSELPPAALRYAQGRLVAGERAARRDAAARR